MKSNILNKPVTSDSRALPKRRGLIGWGYEGKSFEDLLDDCRTWGVGTVVDVRLNPWSHKQDFTKANLSRGFEREGFKYIHLKSLGNPKDNRAGFISSSMEEQRKSKQRFAHAMLNSESLHDLRWLKKLSQREYVLMLCFEKNEVQCHRSVIRELIMQTSLHQDCQLYPTEDRKDQES